MVTRPGKVAREQSASDIFMPLRVSFDRKSGEVLTRDVLLPRTSIFFAKCTFFIWLFATNQWGKGGKFTPRDEPPRKLRDERNGHFSCYLDLPRSIVFHSTGEVTKEPPLQDVRPFAIHLTDLSESKSGNQLTFSNAYDIHGRGEQIVEAHQILKNRQKRQKSRGLLKSLPAKKRDESATNVACFVGVTKVCVGKKKQLKHFKQGSGTTTPMVPRCLCFLLRPRTPCGNASFHSTKKLQMTKNFSLHHHHHL